MPETKDEAIERLTQERDAYTGKEPFLSQTKRYLRANDALTARAEAAEESIKDIAAHATPYGEIPDDPGWVGTYLLSAGALHRALGHLGHTMPSCAAEAQVVLLREALVDMCVDAEEMERQFTGAYVRARTAIAAAEAAQ